MKVIRIGSNEKLANALRRVGLKRIVDSSHVRRALGIPIRGGSTSVQGPKVSIVVPAFNVEAYLEEAVTSIQRQSHHNLEIVIVNDGSTDATGKIADALARNDVRVRVIHKRNGGLGAARNTGLSNTSGEYVTFVDSDDLLPGRAIETLVSSLERSGSDFAIGAMERFNSTRVWVPEWVSQVHDKKREAIQAQDHPPVLWDVFACNKLFRRSTWDRMVGLFPEGVLYEDQECTAKLYVQGAVFDSLTETVYRWRFRDDGSSITQNKHSTEDLEQRLSVARTVEKVLRESSYHGLVDTWYAKLLGDDLFWYYREVPRADETFWHILRHGVQEFYRGASQKAIRQIAFDRRLQMLAIERGTRQDFESFLYFFQEHGSYWSTTVSVDGSSTGYVSALDTVSMDFTAEELLVSPETLAVDATVVRRNNRPDGSILLTGYLVLPNVEPSPSRKLSVALVPCGNLLDEEIPQGGESLRISQGDLPKIASRVVQEASSSTRDPFNDHSAAGFEIEIPGSLAAHLFRLSGAVPTPSWELEVTLEEHGIRWSTRDFRIVSTGNVGMHAAAEMEGSGYRLLLEHKARALALSARRLGFVLENSTALKNSVALQFSDRKEHASTGELTVEVLSKGEVVAAAEAAQAHGARHWQVEIVLPLRASERNTNFESYEVSVVADGKTIGAIESSSATAREMGVGEFGTSVDSVGYLQIDRYTQFGEASSVELLNDGRTLRVMGRCSFSTRRIRQTAPSFILWSPNQTIHSAHLEHDGVTGEFTCDFALVEADADGREISFPLGTYSFGSLMPVGTKLPASVTLVAATGLVEGFPCELSEGRTRVSLGRRPHDGGLQLVFSAPFVIDERGAYAQKQLAQHAFATKRSRSLRDAVLFESFGGRGVCDSPKAIDDQIAKLHPHMERLWTVRDFSVAVPEGAVPVLLYSREWYEALSSSRLLVNNNNFPQSFRKAPGQTYVQTWHGTPLKRVGNDVPAANLSLAYRKLMQREAENYWDFLVAQSPWAGKTLADAFGYEGRVLDQGYPRNDALLGAEADERRRKIRQHFGISDDQTVVLYAPTWRDNLKASSGRYLRPEYLNPNDVFNAFGFESVMMVRGHVNNAGSKAPARGKACIDVSGYPDVNDLYLAADVLVTDYSSVQFDFLNTGKPIIYLAPDLNEYRDTVRGFYFDFETTAPGPICSSSGEAVDALQRLPEVQSSFMTRYDEYRQRFASLEDGSAAARVVDALL